jgi:hypothetical protein
VFVAEVAVVMAVVVVEVIEKAGMQLLIREM